MKDRVLAELRRLEREHAVRVLLAVESGSRAWGFASADSDYDVRFVYAHERNWYLSVFEPRDVIEQMLPGDLDLSGWDLRKTLRLFSKCNLALNEWLGSPIIYFELPGFRQQLVELIPHYFNAIGGMHHYRSMAKRALLESHVDGRIRIKALFSVLRALLACRWIVHTGPQPPTEFAKLVVADWVTRDEREWIETLWQQKQMSIESRSIELELSRATEIQAEFTQFGASVGAYPVPMTAGPEVLDSIQQTWIDAENEQFDRPDGHQSVEYGS